MECFRRVKENLLNDEDNLRVVLHLSEERKQDCDWTYAPIINDYFYSLLNCWKVDENFKGVYVEDYKLICNSRTDKYRAQICNVEMEKDNESVLQTMPEYIRWVTEKGELRYLTLEKTTHLISENPKIASLNDYSGHGES